MPSRTSLSDPRIALSPRGSVVRCPCCDGLALRFDGVGVTLTPSHLRRMRAAVHAVCDESERRRSPWGWALRARTDRESAVFSLSADDADALADLLDAAVAVLDLDALLLDTLGPRPAA